MDITNYIHYTDGIYGAFIVLDKNERQTYAAHMEKMGDMNGH